MSKVRTTVTVCTFLVVLVVLISLTLVFSKRAPRAVRNGSLDARFVRREEHRAEGETRRETKDIKRGLDKDVVQTLPLVR